MNNKTKGFTLIELLVVIAIIGILAALVLVALGSARSKAQDARIKSDISQLRTLAEVIYDSSTSSYATVGACFTTPTAADCKGEEASVTSLKADLALANPTDLTFAANAVADKFCVSAKLNGATAKFDCVDSTGRSSDTLTAGCAAATACPAS